MDESAGDGSHSNKRKSVDNFSGASKRKLAKEVSLKTDESKCLKLTSFMTKLPTIQSSLEVRAENKTVPVSDDLHPDTCYSTKPTDSTETDKPPASDLEHNEQTDRIEFEAVEEEQVVANEVISGRYYSRTISSSIGLPYRMIQDSTTLKRI